MYGRSTRGQGYGVSSSEVVSECLFEAVVIHIRIAVPRVSHRIRDVTDFLLRDGRAGNWYTFHSLLCVIKVDRAFQNIEFSWCRRVDSYAVRRGLCMDRYRKLQS